MEGIENLAAYALTAYLVKVRLARAIAAKHDLEIHQIDACTAVMGGDLEEEIYMYPPQG